MACSVGAAGSSERAWAIGAAASAAVAAVASLASAMPRVADADADADAGAASASASALDQVRPVVAAAVAVLLGVALPGLLAPAAEGGAMPSVWRLALPLAWLVGVGVAAQRGRLASVSTVWLPAVGFGRVIAVHSLGVAASVAPRAIWAVVVAAVVGAVGAGLASLIAERSTRSRFHLAVAMVTTGSLVLRVAAAIRWLDVEATFGDPAYYHLQAGYLAHGHGFVEPFGVASGIEIPTAFHPPLYSALLAVGSVFGLGSYGAHKTITALVSILMVVAAAWIARRLGGPRAGIAAAVLVGLAPNLWMPDGLLWPEGVYVAAIAGVVVASYRWVDALAQPTPAEIPEPDATPRRRRFAAAWGPAAQLGAMIGVASLIRGEGLVLAPILLVGLAWGARRVGVRRIVGAGAVTAAVTCAVLAPWTIRNSLTFDRTVLLSTNSDEVVYYANCADTYRGRLLGSWSYPCQVRDRAAHPGEEPQGEETERVAYWRAKGVAYAREHAGRLPVVAAARVARQFDLFRPGQNLELMGLESRPIWLSRIGQWWYWLSIPFAAIGWWFARRRGLATWPLVSQVMTVAVTAALVYGSIRFRIAADFALLVLAGVGAAGLLPSADLRPPPEGS